MTKIEVNEVVRLEGTDLVGKVTKIEWDETRREYMATVQFDKYEAIAPTRKLLR